MSFFVDGIDCLGIARFEKITIVTWVCLVVVIALVVVEYFVGFLARKAT